MERLGLVFETEPADIDENASSNESPADTAVRLARKKATSVRTTASNRWVLGADQTIGLDGTLLTKPGSFDAAARQLRRLSGRTHRLHCAVALATPDGRCLDELVEFKMEMRELSEKRVREYLREDQPFDCVGAYKIERGGIRLFRAMRGDDYTAIVGLPLTRVWNILEEAGYFSESDCDVDR